jgi:hypothetical protein
VAAEVAAAGQTARPRLEALDQGTDFAPALLEVLDQITGSAELETADDQQQVAGSLALLANSPRPGFVPLEKHRVLVAWRAVA